MIMSLIDRIKRMVRPFGGDLLSALTDREKMVLMLACASIQGQDLVAMGLTYANCIDFQMLKADILQLDPDKYPEAVGIFTAICTEALQRIRES